VIDTEEHNVQVVITDSYHRNSWMQPIHCGKTTTYIRHPAVYRIIVEYDSVAYYIDDFDIYTAYKDRIGDTVDAVLKTCTYDDGSVKHNIISIG
jgi:hypothetical protein